MKTKHNLNTTYFIKVTGRITIPNFYDIVQSLECITFNAGAATNDTTTSNAKSKACPVAYVKPYVLPSPHSQPPFIDTTFIIFTARTYLDLFSVDAALPKYLGHPIERTLADHLLDHCKAGFDSTLMRERCGIALLGCVRRQGRVGWSGGSYGDDGDCPSSSTSREQAPHSLGNMPPVVFADYGLIAQPPSELTRRRRTTRLGRRTVSLN